MKRLFTLLLISFAALSCEMTDENIDDLLNKRDWVVFAEGTELTANVPSEQTVLNYHFESVLDWEVKTDAEWLEIDPMSGKAGKDIKIQIKVFHNKDKEARTGYADLTLSNDESYRITINQAGEGNENDDIVVDIPNNQIWYTSVDGKIVEPYSGEYNTYADALKTFGVNIVSNTYVDGKGVIEFDGDVTTIGYGAFCWCESLTSVTIPDSVTSIGDFAFYYCSCLTSITIPDSVTTIGVWAFRGCDSLISVTIPDSVTTIGDGAFMECDSLTSVTIGDAVTMIGDAVFEYCSSLQEFKGEFASEDGRCLIIDGTLNSFAPAGLTEYTIPDSVTTIGESAFSNCSSLTSITIPDSVTMIGEFAFFCCNSLTSITIPDSVTAIGDYAFSWCSSLTSVTIGDSVTTIGGAAFYYCSSLTSVTIPNSVTSIEYAAFYYCSSLTSVTIPDSVTTIGSYAFRDCSSLTSVTIPDSVTTIGEGAFYYCFSLTSVTIPDSVTEIGYAAFAYCSSLQEFKGKFASEDGRCLIVDGVLNSFALGCGATEYTIPNSVTTIEDYAFWGCETLTSITIPDSVTEIGYDAFAYCSSLTSAYCKATTPPTITLDETGYWDAFDYNASGRKIYVPMESVEAYKSADGWNEYEDVIVGYDFDRNEEVVQPEQIPNNQIWYTSIDGEIVEPYSGVDNNYADALKTFGVNIVSNTYVDGKGVIEFDGDVTVIGQCGFYNCDSLTSVTIPDSVTKIGYWVFGSCSSLTSVTIPDSITTIGMAAFALCTSLTSVTIPNSVTTIDNYAFCDCSSLTSVTIPDSVTTIGGFAFANCSSLTSVTIGDSVTTIGEAAFYNCSSFTSVYCKPTTTPSITVDHNGYWDAFDYNASGRKIYVPMESVEAYKSAQGWSEYADAIVGYNF